MKILIVRLAILVVDGVRVLSPLSRRRKSSMRRRQMSSLITRIQNLHNGRKTLPLVTERSLLLLVMIANLQIILLFALPKRLRDGHMTIKQIILNIRNLVRNVVNSNRKFMMISRSLPLKLRNLLNGLKVFILKFRKRKVVQKRRRSRNRRKRTKKIS